MEKPTWHLKLPLLLPCLLLQLPPLAKVAARLCRQVRDIIAYERRGDQAIKWLTCAGTAEGRHGEPCLPFWCPMSPRMVQAARCFRLRQGAVMCGLCGSCGEARMSFGITATKLMCDCSLLQDTWKRGTCVGQLSCGSCGCAIGRRAFAWRHSRYCNPLKCAIRVHSRAQRPHPAPRSIECVTAAASIC